MSDRGYVYKVLATPDGRWSVRIEVIDNEIYAEFIEGEQALEDSDAYER